MTDHRFPHDAAPYVLGALDPDERRTFEEHLAECPECRAEVQGFAGLPGLLSRIPPHEAASVLTTEAEPMPELTPILLATVRRERRARRWRAVAAGAAAAVAAALVVGFLSGDNLTEGRPGALPTPGPSLTAPSTAPVAFAPVVPNAPVAAEATLADVPDGTEIRLACRYTGPVDGAKRAYTLRVIPKSGEPIQLATWPVFNSYDYGVDMVAPLSRERIESFELVNAAGKVLLRLSA